MKFKDKISVRELVEFILKSGSIESGQFGLGGIERAIEGTKIHKMIQKKFKENYSAEVNITYLYEDDEYSIEITGRIDGIIDGEIITVDEIKTTNKDLDRLEENFLHLAQARCYAYLYAKEKNLDGINVRLTYCNVDTLELKIFEHYYTLAELESFFIAILEKYKIWVKLVCEHNKSRDDSIKKLQFPFKEFREGQRKLSVAVYKTIRDKKILFAEAPTGTGKTIGTLFPAIKALREGLGSKIFYLTAKTITRTVAEETVNMMVNDGLVVKCVTITAKEKICFLKGKCSPEECVYAKGHFDRVNQAIFEALKEKIIDRQKIAYYAEKHKVCPFELSLDISLFCDIVICDYNYAFDLSASLKRFFEADKNDFIYLIDEAHNLVDRGREMYSAALNKRSFMNFKKKYKDYNKLKKALEKVNRKFIEIKKRLNKAFEVWSIIPEDLVDSLYECQNIIEETIVEHKINDDELINLYFEIINFIKISQLFDENYRTFIYLSSEDLKVKLFCLNPFKITSSILNKANSAILFSATLSPLDYYINLLYKEKVNKIKLKSPFSKNNMLVILDRSISTRYSDRENTYDRISNAIKSFSIKKGNYLIFFPSYKYMREVLNRFKMEDTDVYVQNSDMTEEAKELFLKRFSENKGKRLIAFAVMGGIFGEGIDLDGDKLIGVCIVGVGLPQISYERDVIKEHFDNAFGRGFEYAYVYPGFNRVMQAVGRLIRTEKDRGVVLLIDDRFDKKPYRDLIPELWKPVKYISKDEEIEGLTENFWNN
ncbi:ATP-dependent DNA helicase DinG [Caloramator mitchellensis]|uniref:ATP-dependent DNA helicase DinG n=1 Tax=Caloramator mitchellensis TaxID=908809 RepID=A0A0R3JTL6_CALMK|nr:ATP-dependent DNA helicase [Caloramator mitchellensis]KRQ86887.1 ATP-dependent DNA helicase DinG [Caloramator mitchellensis]